jgi:mono/diheme cytochrome c family protein
MKNLSKMMNPKMLTTIALALFFLCTTGLNEASGQPSSEGYSSGPWIAPPSADLLKNPYKGNAAATAEGKKLYTQFCVICHGEKGKGDGMAGMALNPRPANFTKETIQKQTDGAIFWKLTDGRVPMASYKDVLTEKQRWQLVNYLRKFGK